jgi:hypothetical protein
MRGQGTTRRAADCTGLIHLSETDLRSRLGPPVERRELGSDVWIVYAADGLGLRLRCERTADGEARVASWTATFDPGFERLEDAARAVGLWPAAAPDMTASDAAPMIRRVLTCPATGEVFSLTGGVRYGRFVQLSVFDEAPDWL